MAYGQYEAYHAPHDGRYQQAADTAASAPRRVGRLVNLMGAALSVTLMLGVGVWSYRLMVRDVTGVPVIRALGGPIRVSPDDPGGRQAAYQGLAVNAVAAQGGAAGTAQSIALAPPPVELSDEDRSSGALAGRSGSPITVPLPIGNALAAVAPAAEAPQIELAAAPLDLIPASRPGIARSPLPRQRPIILASARLDSVPPAATLLGTGTGTGTGPDRQAEVLLQELVTRLGSSRAIDIDPATLVPGMRLVQLGAYDDEPAARAAWDAFAARFPAYLEGRGRIVEPASAGGRVFYRLRAAGFADEPEARRFCAVMRAENVDCIPILVR